MQVLLLIGLVLAYSVVINLAPVPRDALYIPLNVTFGVAVLVYAARVQNASLADIGLQKEGLASGAMWGALAGAAIGLPALLLILFSPGLDPLLEPERDLGDLLFKVFFWIPIGTVLMEEVVFRGVIPHALQLRGQNAVRRHAVSSLVFGLWHAPSAIRGLQAVENVLLIFVGVVGVVLVTFVGGLAYSAVREWRATLAASVTMHWVLNSFGAVALFLRI